MADFVFSGTHPLILESVLILRGAVRIDVVGAIFTDPVVGTNLFPVRSHKDPLEDCRQLTSFAATALHHHQIAIRAKGLVILRAVIIVKNWSPGTNTTANLTFPC